MFLLPSTKTTYLELEGFNRPAVEPAELPEAVLVRHAAARDEQRIRAIARLDDRRLPAAPHLVAELSGEIVAVMSLATGAVVADPFRRTRDAVDMLRLRAAQVGERERATAARVSHAALAPAAA